MTAGVPVTSVRMFVWTVAGQGNTAKDTDLDDNTGPAAETEKLPKDETTPSVWKELQHCPLGWTRVRACLAHGLRAAASWKTH